MRHFNPNQRVRVDAMSEQACAVHQAVHECEHTKALQRDIDAARAKLLTIERLAKLKAHPGFEGLLRNAESYRDACIACSLDPEVANHHLHTEAAQAQGLLLELLGGEHV